MFVVNSQKVSAKKIGRQIEYKKPRNIIKKIFNQIVNIHWENK